VQSFNITMKLQTLKLHNSIMLDTVVCCITVRMKFHIKNRPCRWNGPCCLWMTSEEFFLRDKLEATLPKVRLARGRKPWKNRHPTRMYHY